MALIKVNNRGQSADFTTEYGGRRNLIINGAMQVWQRGTSFAAGGGIVYTADRFWRYAGTSGNIERSTDAPAGFLYSLHANTTGAPSGGTNYEIERSGFFPQRKYVYSFYMKGDFSNTYLAVNFRNNVGTGTDEVPIAVFSAGNGNGFGNYSDWTRVEKVIDTTGYTPHVNNKIFDLEFGNFAAGGKITGIQLEVGDVATPFEHRSYGEELLLCQRYYCKSYPSEVTPGIAANAGGGDFNIQEDNGNAGRYTPNIHFPVEMRAIPTVVVYPGRTTVSATAGSISQYNGNNIASASNVQPNRKGISSYIQSGSGWNQASLNYTADAEL